MALLFSGGGNLVNMSNAQTGNGEATNRVGRRPDSSQRGPMLVRLVTTVGATPTCTYALETSPDNINWFNAAYIDISTAGVVGGATTAALAAITTAKTTLLLLPVDWPWSFFRVTFSANTNVTNTLDAWSY